MSESQRDNHFEPSSDTESALQHSQSLAAMVDQSLNEIFIFDSSSLRFLYVNRGALANLGYSLEEMTKRTPIDIKPQFDTAQFESKIQPLRTKQQEKLVFEAVHQRKDGSTYHVEVHLSMTEYLGRDSFVAIILDITDRKQNEWELHLSRASLANSGDAVFMVDELGRFLFVNESACARLGYTRDELLTMTVPEVDAEVASLDEYTGRIVPLIQSEKTVLMQGTHRRKDGTKFPVEISVTLVESDGSPVLCAHVRDLTEKVAAEQERIRGQFFLDNSQDAVYWVKEDSSFVYVNEAATKMLGYSRKQLLQMRVVHIDPDYPPDVWKDWWEQMRAERYNVVKTKHQREDGSFIWAEVTVHFFEHAGEEFLVGVTRDITAKEEAEAAILRAKQLAEENEERFNWVMTNANIGVYDWNPETDETEFDTVMRTQLGYPPNEPWKKFFDVAGKLHPDDEDEAHKFRDAHLSRPHDIYEASFRLKAATGEYRWVRSIARGVVAADGETVERVMGVHIDITDSVTLQQEIQQTADESERAKLLAQESEQRFRALADSASPLAWTTELDSTCSWLNKRWLQYSGTTLESQLDYGWVETVHPDDRERIKAAYSAAFEKQDAFTFDYRLRRHDGVYRWFTVNATPRFDEQREFRGYVGMSFDSHDTRLAREALEASEATLKDTLLELAAKEQRLNLAVAGTTDALWDWDTETDAVWYAPRFLEILGYNASGDERFPPVLDSFGDSVHPDDREHTWAAIEDHLQKQQPYDVRYRLRRVDGSYIWCRARGKAVRNQDGKAVRMSGSVQNISDLVAAEDRLLETNRDLKTTNEDLEQFAYVASHDLRTPLRGIAHVASILREDESDNLADSSLQYLDKVEIRVQRMEALLDDMLTYSRAGRNAGQVEAVNASKIVQDVIEMISPREGIRISIAEGMPTLQTFISPLRQAFQNLIGNAVKYHDKEEGTVQVTAREQSDFFQFTVSDDGPGIEPKYHEQIFDMFRRLHSRDSIEGTGLGLALVRKIVGQFGGDVWVESEVGDGADFHFTWPKQITRSSRYGN